MGIRHQPIDLERLRKAAPFPTFSVKFQFGFSISEILFGESELWPEQIAKLRSRLKTTPSATRERFILANLLTASDQNATKELARVVSETKAALRKSPRNPELLLQLGESLEMQSEHARAEAVLRRAAAVDPEDWRIQVALGASLTSQMLKEFQEDATFQELQQANQSGNQDATIAALKQFLKKSGASEKLKVLAGRGKAISTCYNRAVALSSKHPVPLMYQLTHRVFGSEEFWKKLPTLESEDSTESKNWMIERLCSPAKIAALKQAITHQSESPKLIATIAVLEYTGSTILLSPEQSAASNPYEYLPGKTKAIFQQSIRTIRGFLRSPNTSLRSRALQSLAVLHFLQLDVDQAEKHIMDSQKLGKLNQNSLDLMSLIYNQPNRMDKAEAFYKGVLSRTPDLSSYQRLASLQFDRGGLAEGKKTATAALKHHPDDVLSHLMMLTWGIRENQQAQIKESLKQLSKSGVEPDLREHMIVIRGFVTALEGRVDLARTIFQQFPENEAAKEALIALGT